VKIMNNYRLPKKLWGGFTMGKLDLDQYTNGGDSGWYGTFYSSKREAKKHYRDVRRVEIREVKSGR
jgi:hypothetical protein